MSFQPASSKGTEKYFFWFIINMKKKNSHINELDYFIEHARAPSNDEEKYWISIFFCDKNLTGKNLSCVFYHYSWYTNSTSVCNNISLCFGCSSVDRVEKLNDRKYVRDVCLFEKLTGCGRPKPRLSTWCRDESPPRYEWSC